MWVGFKWMHFMLYCAINLTNMQKFSLLFADHGILPLGEGKGREGQEDRAPMLDEIQC